MRSTKETSRNKAWEVALGLERAERTAKTERQIRTILSEILRRNTGEKLRSPSVREWFAEWLEGKKGETRRRYSGITNAFLAYLEARADQPLVDIVPRDVKGYIDLKRKTRASDKTIMVHLQALKSAFNEAKRLQVIDDSPASPIKVDVGDEEERECFTPKEVKTLIDTAEGEWQTLILVGYYTGLRLVAAASLKWDHLNLKEGTVLSAPGKRDSKGRWLPLHTDLLRHLELLKRARSDREYVMPGLASAESGGKRGLSLDFRRLALRAGVDLKEVERANGYKFCKKSFHSLRHGFVSGLANQGVASSRGRVLTGHKKQSTHARYTHHELEVLRSEVNKLPSIPGQTSTQETAKGAPK